VADQDGWSRADLLGGEVGDPAANLAVPPRRRSRRRTWLLAGCLVMTLLAGMAAVALFLFLPMLMVGGMLSTEGGREMAKAAWDANNAPGTSELKVAGCQTASVMDLGRMVDAMAKFGIEDDDSADSALLDLPFVTCNLGFAAPDDLDCAAVAVTYATAVPDAPSIFVVTVNKATGVPLGCEGYYDHAGSFLGELHGDYEPPR